MFGAGKHCEEMCTYLRNKYVRSFQSALGPTRGNYSSSRLVVTENLCPTVGVFRLDNFNMFKTREHVVNY